MVVSWTGDVTAEQPQRARASNCQGACRRFQLPEILSVYRHRDAGDLLVKARETLDIGGDDTDRDEIHDVLLRRVRPQCGVGLLYPEPTDSMVSVVFQHTVSREIAVRRADRLFQIIQVLRRS